MHPATSEEKKKCLKSLKAWDQVAHLWTSDRQPPLRQPCLSPGRIDHTILRLLVEPRLSSDTTGDISRPRCHRSGSSPRQTLPSQQGPVRRAGAGNGLPHRSPGGVGCTWDARGCRLGTGSGAVVSSLQPQAGGRRTLSGAEQPQRGSFDIYPVSLPFVPSNAFSFLLIKEK